MAHAGEDPLQGSAIELLVVDDENGGLAQRGFLRSAEGGARV
jgi:hypothetical protein